jgi:hypothetical protein
VSATFLVDPSAFPSSTEGAPWGPERSCFEVAGISIRLSGLSPRQREAVASLYAPASRSTVEASLYRVDPSFFHPIDTRGWSYSLDFEYGSSHTGLVGMDWVGRIEWGSGAVSASIWVATEEPGAFHGALENFLRVLSAHVLLLEGGALLHSASVLSPAGADLFVGPSGAGKSTISRAARTSGRAVLSDDLNVVTAASSLGGSTFFSEIGSRFEREIPLRAIYRLEKGVEDRIRPMGKGEALATLVACSPFVNHSRFLAHRLWENLQSLAARVPARVLTFRREAAFWPLLEA